jgi:hypothetical protein
MRILSQKKTYHKKGLVEWLKVLALGSNPSSTKRKEGRKEGRKGGREGGREGPRRNRCEK